MLFAPDYCGRCEQCVLGRTPYCDEAVAVTFTGTRLDGSPRAHQNGSPVRASFFGQSSFATHSLVTERNIVPVPAGAPLRYLAGFTCGVQAGAGAMLNAMPVSTGSKVAVWGTGAVGLAAVMAAAASGAAEIVALDRVGHRLALAAELGGTATIDTSGQDLSDVATAVVRLTGRGASVALDTRATPTSSWRRSGRSPRTGSPRSSPAAARRSPCRQATCC